MRKPDNPLNSFGDIVHGVTLSGRLVSGFSGLRIYCIGVSELEL
jgi:hypothetical protein